MSKHPKREQDHVEVSVDLQDASDIAMMKERERQRRTILSDSLRDSEAEPHPLVATKMRIKLGKGATNEEPQPTDEPVAASNAAPAAILPGALSEQGIGRAESNSSNGEDEPRSEEILLEAELVPEMQGESNRDDIRREIIDEAERAEVVEPGNKKKSYYVMGGLLLVVVIVATVVGVTVSSSGDSGDGAASNVVDNTATSFGNLTYFVDNTQLREAIDSYLKNSSSTLQYGASIGDWDVSRMEDFTLAFSPEGRLANSEEQNNTKLFNEDINNWNMSSAVDLYQMLHNARAFNQDLSAWDVSKVVNMRSLFRKTKVFNSDISTWNTSSLVIMRQTFDRADGFNQDLSNWDVSKVRDFESAFEDSDLFNQSHCEWLGSMDADAVVSKMFRRTACLNVTDPIIPHGPMCHPC